MSKNQVSSYLESGRLGEVLALIQVLAYDSKTSRSDKGLECELKGKPLSDTSWGNLAKNHPEFFRVRVKHGSSDKVSLISRYVLPSIDNNKNIRPQLDPTIVNKLMEVAIELHDRQVIRSKRWHSLIPMFVAIISAGAAIGAAIIGVTTK